MTNTVTATPQEALTAFSSMIESYEHRVGHACRAVAAQLPSYLSFPPEGRLLDNACGTGAVTQELSKVYPQARMSASDVVPMMIESFGTIIDRSPTLKSQMEDLRVEDGQALTYPDDWFDASITNFGIFFFPDPVAGAKEIYRTLKPGGTAVVTVWKSAGFKPILWEAQDRIKPFDPLVDLSLIDPWSDTLKLEGVLKDGGFKDVKFDSVKVGMWGEDKEDFKTVLVENLAAMVSKNWNEKEKAQLAPVISHVIDEMQAEFCITDGTRVGCVMEAWVASCTK